MSETFSLTLQQMIVMSVFMVIGFIFRKFKLFPNELSVVLSKLIVIVFLPALVFNTFAKNLTVRVLTEKADYLLISTLMVAVIYAISIPLSKLFSSDSMTRNIYKYGFTISNMGYMGYPLVGAIFGETVLLNMMIFAIPFNIFIYTVGMYILNPAHELKLSKLLNPTIIAIILGITVGLSGLKIPALVYKATEMASDCMSPSAMILSGFVLAKTPILKMLSNAKMYIVSLIRLAAIPAAAFGVLYLCGVKTDILLVSTTILCMPMGLNNVVFPEAFGGDSTTGAQSCFVSNVLGLITIPLVFSFLNTLL